MRIAQICSAMHQLSPRSPQGIYHVTANLANGLVDRGHDVTVFASKDADVRAKIVSISSTCAKTRGLPERDILRENMELLSSCYRRAGEFDLIHSHFSLLGCHFSATSPVITVHSLHSPITDDLRPHLMRYKGERFISFSLAQRKQMPELNWVANVYHGIDTNTYTFNPTPQDYVLYLGRITAEKGVHHAIAAAKKAGVQILISGTTYPDERYWAEMIEPHVDGNMVRFLGPSNLERKVELMRNAKALLFPTLYNEVFGLVMTEAMSSGTPVIGFDNGSVPEVIQDGETGFVVRTETQMAAAIKKISTISRQACRDRAVRLFSVQKMVSSYERVYARLVK